MKILFIGSFSYKNNRLDGVTIKSRTLKTWLEDNDIDIDIVDVDNWKKRYIYIIKEILKKYKYCDKIIISSSSRGASILLHFLKIINNKKDIFYFVAGGKLADMIERGKYKINLYENIKLIYVEPQDMVIKLNKLGLSNVEQINNFRSTSYKPQIKNIKDEVRFVFFSRVIKEKGIEELLLVFERLKVKYKNIYLDVYGQVDLKYYEYIKTLCTDGVVYKGEINPNGTDEYYILSQYDVFVLPTYHDGEGLPGALIDAYISGLAVITSNWKYANQYVDDGNVGLIHEYKNFEDLYYKMEYMINNKEILHKYKKNSLKNAERFLADNVLNNFKKILIG